eukprot:2094589-Prymnesium_polylepis.1
MYGFLNGGSKLYADYVAAGCIGPAPREWPDSADRWVERTHAPPAHPHPGRAWCSLCIPKDPMIARV